VTEEGQTPLMVACVSGNEEKVVATAVLVLLNSGANPNIQDVLGYAPLHRAAERPSLLILSLLISAGANVNVKTGQGEYPLLFSFNKRDKPCIHALLTSPGCDVEISTADGIRPIHLLAESPGDDYELMKMFMLRGAQINAKTHDGETPLTIAVRSGNPKIADLLRREGAL